MAEPLPSPAQTMTADEFLRWAVEQDTGRHDLVEGQVVAMSPQTGAHLRTRQATDRALQDALAAAGLDCQALPEGATVVVNDRTVFEPDALVNCGKPMDDAAVAAPNPVVVVEVLSKSTRRVDSSIKLAGYFRVPSVVHYLLLWPESRTVVHHRRGEEGRIESAILRSGTLTLDPPGISLAVEALFPPAA